MQTIGSIIEDAQDEINGILDSAAKKIIRNILPYVQAIAMAETKGKVRESVEKLEDYVGETFETFPGSLANPDAVLLLGEDDGDFFTLASVTFPAWMNVENPKITITNERTEETIEIPLTKKIFKYLFDIVIMDRD